GLSSHRGTPERSSADLGCRAGKNQGGRHVLRHLGLPCVANSRSLGSAPLPAEDVEHPPMTTEVLIVGRDSDVFAERLKTAGPGLRGHPAHNPGGAPEGCPDCGGPAILTHGIFAGLRAARAPPRP